MNSTAPTYTTPPSYRAATRRAFRNFLAALMVLAIAGAAACAHSPTEQSIDDQADLQLTVQTFHRDMRWMRWESAAMVVAPEKRQAFLARYEELGEDFHVANLEMKSLDRLKDEVVIEIEQESYTEPAMIVKKERYVEVWKKPESDWFMTKRMLKDDYKEMKKLEAARKLHSQKPSRNTEQVRSTDAPDVANDAGTNSTPSRTEFQDEEAATE